jgi:Zn-dependent protease with chaperone function
LAAASAIAALVTGIPMSIALTPVLFALAVLFTWTIGLIAPVPQELWDAYSWTGRVLIELVESVDDPATVGVTESDLSRIPLDLLAAGALVWMLPGMLFMLLCWALLRAVFRHGGPGGILLSLGARDPKPGDLEERQLVNIIEELAIASGVTPPRVMLLDSDVANAAVVGSSRKDATVVVSRALLDDLNRDATQGVLANLVASIGNGDLRGARSIVAVFETFGLAGILLKAPVSGPARRMLWRIVRYLFGRHTPEQRANEAQAVAGMLTKSFWDTEEEDDFSYLNEDGTVPAERRGPSVRLLLGLPFVGIIMFIGLTLAGFPDFMVQLAFAGLAVLGLLLLWYQRRYVLYGTRHVIKTFRLLMMLPYYLAAMMPQVVLMLMIPFMLEPVIALLWRTRRYLSDASAVQFTRNPDGIASGLVGLVSRGGVIPGGQWASPMFVVGPEAAHAKELVRYQEQQRKELEELRRVNNPQGSVLGDLRVFATQATGTGAGIVQSGVDAHPMAQHGLEDGSFSGSSGSMVSFHPPLNKRLARLRRMGATVADVDLYGKNRKPLLSSATNVALSIAMVPLVLLVVVLLVIVLALLLAVSLLFCGLLMMMVYGLVLLLAP